MTIFVFSLSDHISFTFFSPLVLSCQHPSQTLSHLAVQSGVLCGDVVPNCTSENAVLSSFNSDCSRSFFVVFLVNVPVSAFGCILFFRRIHLAAVLVQKTRQTSGPQMFDFDNSCLLATAAAVPAAIATFVGGVVVVLFCKQISDYDENKFWFIVLTRSTSSTRIKIPCSVVAFKIVARGNFAWRVCTSGCFLNSLANRKSLRSILVIICLYVH